MPVEIARGFAGTENAWNTGQESGFITYMRGTIGDAPQPTETLLLGETKLLTDYPSSSETMLHAHGMLMGDVPSVSESATITNS